MLGVIFFVPALRSSLLLYSNGFALLTFKNGVEIAAVERVAASIDRHAVPLWSWNRRRRPRAGKGRHCRQSVFL